MSEKNYFRSPHKDNAPPVWEQVAQMREEWMQRNGLSHCRAHGLRWLAPAGSTIRRLKNGDWQHPDLFYTEWFDHQDTFYHRASKRYVMISQPYDLTEESLQRLREFCAQWNITVELSWEGWHYPSRCPLLVFRGGGN